MSLSYVDHLIYGTPDLEASVEALENRLGVRAAVGGSHPGEGTRNALMSLGPGMYFEIMAPDPAQPDPGRPRWLGLDELVKPGLIAWAAIGADLDDLHRRAREADIGLGSVLDGGRRRPDGSRLSWRLTDPRAMLGGGVMPFFIDWLDSPHPSESAPAGLELVGFRGQHPDSVRLQGVCNRLELPFSIEAGSVPSLTATLKTPLGVVELT